MASANKSTGLQIALVFTVMSTIVATAMAFVEYRAAVDTELKRAEEAKKRSASDSEKQVAKTNLDNLKAVLGYQATEEIGKPESEDASTVIGQLRKLVAESAPGDLTQPTVAATIQRLGQAVANLQSERAALTAESIQLKDKITGLQSQYQKLVDSYDKARESAEKDRGEAQKSKETAVVAKDKEIAERQAKIQQQQAEFQALQAETTKKAEEDKTRIGNLEQINFGLRNEQAKAHDMTFEVPNGTVEWVDRDTKNVWINRGEADGLRKGTTFSVYRQANRGVARGQQDIKGAVEVTKVVGPHMAEARITRQRNSDPIIEGDPIYTPIWKPGQRESFAVVGLIDIDGDGVGDRDVLHDLVNSANGSIVDEVDDKGVRHPTTGKIDVSTKFLVVGRIPDYTESRPDEQAGHKLIGELHDKMVKQAQEHGVRVVSLEDFLSYIGYEPGRRVWRPGKTAKWNLKLGNQNIARPDKAPRPDSMVPTSMSRQFGGGTQAPRTESLGTRTAPNK